MLIGEAILVAIVVTILVCITLVQLSITVWSSLVLSLLVGLAVMMSFYPVSDLLSCTMSNGVLAYITIVIVVFVFATTYLVFKCCTDIEGSPLTACSCR